MLGIDVLEADGFAAIRGKRIGLLSHPAGVNRRGTPTLDVLRRAPGVQLTTLYAVEHGFDNQAAAEKAIGDTTDRRTGLPVISLYKGHLIKPTAAQLRAIDALVIDLQDIGTRSYTFASAMKLVVEACFEHGKEVVILDRPNPLGGLKVSGPPLDANQMSDVGRFRVPYVHGLTMGELARLAVATQAPGGINVTEAVRARGKLTVIPMRGWYRWMRWPETGLQFQPTSGLIQDFSAVMGYPMTGLGCIIGNFSHGVGEHYPFRGVFHHRGKQAVLEQQLRALKLPGVQFSRVAASNRPNGPTGTGLYVHVTDYEDWDPTELSFWLMKIACQLEPRNPFATATAAKRREFLIHVGSNAFYQDLATKGASIDLEAWLRQWREQARIYQEQSKRYWLYQ